MMPGVQSGSEMRASITALVTDISIRPAMKMTFACGAPVTSDDDVLVKLMTLNFGSRYGATHIRSRSSDRLHLWSWDLRADCTRYTCTR